MPVKNEMGIAFQQYFNNGNKTGESVIIIKDLKLCFIHFELRKASLSEKGGRKMKLGR